jgi:hypothetical protein
MAYLERLDWLLLCVAELITSVRIVWGEGAGPAVWLDAPGDTPNLPNRRLEELDNV